MFVPFAVKLIAWFFHSQIRRYFKDDLQDELIFKRSYNALLSHRLKVCSRDEMDLVLEILINLKEKYEFEKHAQMIFHYNFLYCRASSLRGNSSNQSFAILYLLIFDRSKMRS
jgi:hypothetical protein